MRPRPLDPGSFEPPEPDLANKAAGVGPAPLPLAVALQIIVGLSLALWAGIGGVIGVLRFW